MLQIRPVELTLGERLVQNQACIDALMLEQSHLAAEFAKTNEWELEGYYTPYDWVRFNCKVKGNVAMDYFVVGQHLDRLELTVEAIIKGEVGYAHLTSMADVAHAAKGFDESELLPVAKEHSPGKFYRKCLHYRHALDAKRYSEDQEQLFHERALRLSTAQDGCLLISGVLDPVSGAVVRNALEPLAQPSGAHDDRTRDQRNADALVERVSGGAPAHLQVTATVETLVGMSGAAAGEVEFTLPISADSVQTMACDCSVTRILLSQESLVIDIGRSKRVINSALRKALTVRDGHCRWPGCERPASLCDGHHLVHWINGGATDLDNLVLLCRRHHRMVHEGGWQLIRDTDGHVISIAPTITFGLPRGPD